MVTLEERRNPPNWRWCSKCGFLALRNKVTGELIEADADYRKVALFTIDQQEQEIINWPLCFVQAWGLDQELLEEHSKQQTAIQNKVELTKNDWSARVLRIIVKNRVCPRPEREIGFIEWHRGFTPKEHHDMWDREQTRRWQEKRDKADRKWRIIEMVVIAVITVSMAGVFTLLGAFIQRGGQPQINVFTSEYSQSNPDTSGESPTTAP